MLSISKRLLFDEVHRHALGELSKRLNTMDPVKQLLLANEHSIDDWRIDAYQKLVERPDRWTMEDTQKLPLEDILIIANCRDLYRDKNNWTMETVEVTVPVPSPWGGSIREVLEKWTVKRSALVIVHSELNLKELRLPPVECTCFPILASVPPLLTPPLARLVG